MKVEVVPSILSADAGRLADQVAEAERGGADRIQVDVMDGHFVPNLTFGPVVVEAVRRSTRLPIEAHLMVERPELATGLIDPQTFPPEPEARERVWAALGRDLRALSDELGVPLSL